MSLFNIWPLRFARSTPADLREIGEMLKLIEQWGNGIPVNPEPVLSTQRPTTGLYRGRTIFETDTGALYVWYGATTGWRPPWNQAWGWLDRKILTGGAASTSGTATLTVLTSATLTLPASRRIRATVSGAAFGTVVADRFLLEIHMDGVQVEPDTEFYTGATAPYYPVNLTVDSSPAAGARVWTFKATRVAGTGVLTFDLAKPVTLLIEDIGPNAIAPAS